MAKLWARARSRTRAIALERRGCESRLIGAWPITTSGHSLQEVISRVLESHRRVLAE
jgi:hypothetical protein